MKKSSLLIPFFLLLLCFPAFSYDLAGSIDQALTDLDSYKSDPDLCVLTDAVYVMSGGSYAGKYVDLLQERTGCSIGKGNLLFFHHPANHPLTVALYRRDTADCVVITVNGEKIKTVKQNIGGADEGPKWEKICKSLGREAFAITTIFTAWGQGAPGDFLKCAEFHNHLCPGVTSGYIMSRFILDEFPPARGKSMTYIASPVWCKEDALAVMLDVTPGKRSLVAKPLTKEQRSALKSDKAAGILVVGKKSSIHAYILSFDWSKADLRRGPGIKSSSLSWKDDPATYVSVLLDKEITRDEFEQIKRAGTNPYEILDFVNK